MGVAIDRLSDLPDNILCCNILSLLPLKDAMRSSVLSTRWRRLLTHGPNLHFSYDFFQSIQHPDRVRCECLGYLKHTVDNILQRHSALLESFMFYFGHSFSRVNIANIEQWIHCAAAKGVKRMCIFIHFSRMEIHLPPSIFACHLLAYLELEGFSFTEIPTDFGGFLFLKTCSLSCIEMAGDRLQQLIELCPLLQKLVLKECDGPKHLRIRAPNLNELILIQCNSAESLRADCPQLLKLELENCDCRNFNCESLKTLSLTECPDFWDVPFFTLLGSFPDLEELKLTAIFIQDMAARQILAPWRDVAAEKVLSHLTFPKLKKVHVEISPEMGQKEVALLRFLLKKSPSLEIVRVIIPSCPKNIHNQMFIGQVLDLDRVSLGVEIRFLNSKTIFDAICMEMPFSDSDY